MKRMTILKMLVYLILLSVSSKALAQSRKRQIQSLSKQVDSLNGVIVVHYGLMAQSEKQLIALKELLLIREKEIAEGQTRLKSQIAETEEQRVKLEMATSENERMSQQIQDDLRLKIKRSFSDVIGNSTSNYPIRITGEMSGCIGGGCEEVPSDIDLYKAIEVIDEDYNGDGVIGYDDFEPAISQTGDVNRDGAIDLYDIVYPKEIKTAAATLNSGSFIADNNMSYYLTGRISENGDRILFDYPIDISYTSSVDGNSKIFTEKRKELFLLVSSDIIVYRKRKVVLKGKINSGITQAYKDLFLFHVDEIVGVAAGKEVKKLMLGSRELKVGDKIRFEDPELYGWKNIDMSTHYVLYKTLDGCEIQIGSSGDRYLKVEFITAP